MHTSKVDSITLSAPRAYAFKNGIDHKITADGEGTVTLYKFSEDGLTITINPVIGQTVITISSKILGDDFLSLISNNTIERVWQAVARCIGISIAELMHYTVRKVDATSDIFMKNKETVIADLYELAGMQTRYRKSARTYKSKGEPTSFWLKRDNNDKERIDYLSVYGKYAQLTNKGKNGGWAFIGTLGHEGRERALQLAENIVRFETKLSSRRMIRKHYNLPDKHIPIFQDILDSRINVNLNMVQTIYGKVACLEMPHHKLTSVTDLGHYHALAQTDYCIESAFQYLNQIVTVKNKSRTVKRLQAILLTHDEGNHQRLINTYKNVLKALQ
ncbi:hypothetical protein [Rufibacter ruber]|uniref:hypothetical protein n=1 Tax=Rufibacter ruber TaxID=1783499 RepID=UPI0008329B95|nr:hypothetical protein [Rufibacter ruber]